MAQDVSGEGGEKSRRHQSYTSFVTQEQLEQLRSLLEEKGFAFESRPHTVYFARKGKLCVSAYRKGPKVLIQGSGMEEFVQFVFEPKILGRAEFGYEEQLHPEWFEPHFGLDEAGKGDYFGPLVIAGVYVDGETARSFFELGLRDSKRIHSEKQLDFFANKILASKVPYSIVKILPKRYNELIEEIGGLNKLLAWGHARVIENLLKMKPECPRSVSDQFADESVLLSKLMEKGRKIKIVQKTKAESDPAVAAASILARSTYLKWLKDQAKLDGEETAYPRGVSKEVIKRAAQVALSKGQDYLKNLVKLHFVTTKEVLNYQTEEANFEGENFEVKRI
ncbi:MAG: ribonuclease HIII [Chthoniobacterales bacterium]|nr:ribonuclease HIII [Chthoniobacterales bacterium]